MTLQLTSDQVWQEIEKNLFGVLGMVTAKNESRTVGINFVVDGHKLCFNTEKRMWKTKHIAANPHVSLTMPISKRIPFIPWLKIPPATITYSGEAKVLAHSDVKAEVLQKLYRNVNIDEQAMAELCVIEVTPQKDFITYGVGIPLMQMRFPDKARAAPRLRHRILSSQVVLKLKEQRQNVHLVTCCWLAHSHWLNCCENFMTAMLV